MQRAKHADRRKATRQRLERGEAVEAADAAHLTRDEIIAALQTFMKRNAKPPAQHAVEPQSEAEPLDRTGTIS